MPHTITLPSTSVTTAPATTRDVARQITVIKQQYQADDWHRVERYLEADPSSAELLAEAKRHIQRVFGEGTEVLLDVTPDPTGIDHPFLYARLWTGEDRREMSKKLHQFDEEWWLDASASGDARLEFAIAARPVEDIAVAF